MIFYIRQEWMSLGNRFTILDQQQDPVYFVEREGMVMGHRFSLTNQKGKELATIKKEPVFFQTIYSISIEGLPFATLTQEWSWFEKKFLLDVPGPNDYEIEGAFWPNEFVFRRYGGEVARVSKEQNIPLHYGVVIAKDEDVIPILSTCIVIDRIMKDSSG